MLLRELLQFVINRWFFRSILRNCQHKLLIPDYMKALLDGNIRYQGIGAGVVEAIVEERKRGGTYKTFFLQTD